jgi:hypothetical protein
MMFYNYHAGLMNSDEVISNRFVAHVKILSGFLKTPLDCHVKITNDE